MSLDQRFEEAIEAVKKFTKRPLDDELLELYGLYKQATVGDVNTPRPNMLDMKGRAKWDSWKSKYDTAPDDAKEAYIKYANMLTEKYK